MKKRMHPAVMVKILLIIGICAFSLFPIMWCLSTSLKPESQIYEVPPRWIPREVTWVHYGQILRDSNMLHYFKNTVILATGTTLITMTVSVLAAYGFSRYKFTGSRCLIWTILFARVLPRER